LSQALGQAMLQQRTNLPRARDFSSAEDQVRQQVIDSSLRQIRHQQERASLSDLDRFVESELKSLPASWQSWIGEEIRDLAIQRRSLLDTAIAADDSLLQALNELDFAQRELSDVVTEYNRFLDERLLWVRTGEPLSWEAVTSMAAALGVIFSLENWGAVIGTLFSLGGSTGLLLFGLALFAVLTKQRKRLFASLVRSGRKVGQLRHDRFRYSMRALLYTLLLALPWPVLMIVIGLHLQLAYGAEAIDVDSALYQTVDWSGEFVPAIGAALSFVAWYLFYFLALRVFCDRRGLAVMHFHWSKQSTGLLHREAERLMIVFLPALFLLIAAVRFDPSLLAGGFSRLLFIVICLALAWFFARVLSPTHGVFKDYYVDRHNLVYWLRYLWLALGVILPIALAVLTVFGYVYTAAQLGQRLVDTLWLLVAIILVYQLVVRWVVLMERQLAFRDALERRRAQRAAREAHEGESVPAEVIEEPEIDFSALSADTSRLIHTVLIVLAAFGAWAIWSDVMPALRILDNISLWTYGQTVEGVEQQIPVTLGDILVVLLIIAFGGMLARRMPALMEFALFARFDITAGSRYAISMLTQYSIVAVSVIAAFSFLGVSWGEIQWLIAALGVGIGFGLQEIIANFICGLILLFERPIRIGDIVTVGDTSGVVTKIRIRSTTIRNWDQQELLVPNKEFITGRLLNWTLSDPTARIMISVGIAYGSDVGKALEILLKCAEEHERVLDDPPPLVTFEGFGD
ncbi:MAG: mechanosensitive ion channel, partial [Gammaproteobacteria bacterium]|nr:mechanosensitive ion channel [Gammaproteobacteria bacterium]